MKNPFKRSQQRGISKIEAEPQSSGRGYGFSGSNLDKRLHDLIAQENLDKLPGIQKLSGGGSTLGVIVACHYGDEDADYRAVYVGPNATRQQIASALGTSEGAIDQNSFEQMRQGNWYLAKQTQIPFEPTITEISLKPIKGTKLLE